jgi:diguanylate cyclase
MMNDETYYNKKRIREEWNLTLSQDDPHRAGIQFARRVRLARAVGWQRCFSPLRDAGHPFFTRRLVAFAGWLGVRLAPFAWQLSCRAASPHQQEISILRSMPLSPGSGLA